MTNVARAVVERGGEKWHRHRPSIQDGSDMEDEGGAEGVRETRVRRKKRRGEERRGEGRGGEGRRGEDVRPVP